MDAQQATELRDFLETFLDGILNEGLTQPLARWSQGRTSPIADPARALHDLLVAGQTPEQALDEMQLAFPEPVGELLLEGARTGEFDYVAEDMLQALAQASPQVALDALLRRYRERRPGTTVCVGCIEREIDRMLRRAQAEDATTMHLGWDAVGYMEQRYTGAYVVSVRQPSRRSVVEGVASHLQRVEQPAPGVERELVDGTILLRRGNQKLTVKVVV